MRLGRAERRARELAVAQVDPPARELACDIADVVRAHLMPETARAAVDHHGHGTALEPEQAGRAGVVDLIDRLHLEKVVARVERPELAAAALARADAHGRRLGAGEHASLLALVEVALRAEAHANAAQPTRME